MNDTDTAAVPKLLTTKDLAEILGEVSTRTLEDWRRKGSGPDFVTVGGKVRYRPVAVDRWLRAHERGNGQKVA